jgi:Family of unknown function (DUF6288)/HEAT repeats
MNSFSHRIYSFLTTALTLGACATLNAASRGAIPQVDLTAGEKIPAAAPHDWTLGAIGARGWMYSDQFDTTDARQVAITKVDQGSPCAEVFAVGDVILGVAGKAFSNDPRKEIGQALIAAEAGDGKISFSRWRKGSKEDVVVSLPVLGKYSPTAPYDCAKSTKILQLGCAALSKSLNEPNYGKSINAIARAVNALALLASGDKTYMPLVKREVAWAADFEIDGMAAWYYGYTIMLVAEYQMATGDTSFSAGMRRMALEAAKGQSNVGSWGHKFAQPDGRLFGYGMMNAPGVPLTSALVLARMAGVKDPAIDLAIERSATLLRFYIGKGAIPYGDHAPWTQTHEDNGKSGMAAYLFHLLGEAKGAEFFSRMAVASHSAERDGGHSGNYTNFLWAMPAVALAGPQATGAWMKEFGAWNFDLARRWDGTFVHQGQPQAKNDSYGKWDATGSFLLAYAMPAKQIYLTGKKSPTVPFVTAAEADSLIADGRGWSNRLRHRSYTTLSSAQLLESLGSWSPSVRERAAFALASQKTEPPIKELIQMLSAPALSARYGACLALGKLGSRSSAAVAPLMKSIDDPDLWLRVQAAEALASIGQPAMPALPALLKRLARPASAQDPRAMEQRFLCSVVFAKMLKKSLENVDDKLLQEAIVAALKNQDGRARGEIGTIFEKLSYEQIKPLLPAIYQSTVKPAPSGEMFASNIRIAGCELLAKHRFAEGMELCLQVIEIENWGKKDRIPRVFKAIKLYGGSAKPILPQLRTLHKGLLAHTEAKSLKPFAEDLANMIASIESSNADVELRSLKRL